MYMFPSLREPPPGHHQVAAEAQDYNEMHKIMMKAKVEAYAPRGAKSMMKAKVKANTNSIRSKRSKDYE